MMDSHIETVEELLRGIEGPHKGDKAKVEEDLEAVEAIFRDMKMEIHSGPTKAAKDGYNAKINAFKTRVATAKKALLFSGSSSAAAAAAGNGPNAGAYARQQSAEEKQAETLAILQAARRQLAETEDVGVSTVNELQKQQEQIQKSRQNMEEVNSGLNHSNKLLNKMSQWWRGYKLL